MSPFLQRVRRPLGVLGVAVSGISLIQVQASDDVFSRMWIGVLIGSLTVALIASQRDPATEMGVRRSTIGVSLAALAPALVYAGGFDTTLVAVISIGLIVLGTALALLPVRDR